MPHVWMMSFDWDGFNKLIARPSAALVSRLVRQIRSRAGREHWVSVLPHDEAELAAYLKRLLPAEDWYVGKSPAEANAIDRIVNDIFDDQIPLKPMKLEPLCNGGVTQEVFEIATGRAVLDDSRDTPRSRVIYFRRVKPTSEGDASELGALGARPFRHGSWDHRDPEEWERLNNPFIYGADATYLPDYSIHSPEQVDRLRQELIRAGDRLRTELARVKSKTLRSDAMANFEEELVGPIERASDSRRAVWACWDS
jgi:hypothetical protein